MFRQNFERIKNSKLKTQKLGVITLLFRFCIFPKSPFPSYILSLVLFYVVLFKRIPKVLIGLLLRTDDLKVSLRFSGLFLIDVFGEGKHMR